VKNIKSCERRTYADVAWMLSASFCKICQYGVLAEQAMGRPAERTARSKRRLVAPVLGKLSVVKATTKY
jgi:hypothetical protein